MLYNHFFITNLYIFSKNCVPMSTLRYPKNEHYQLSTDQILSLFHSEFLETAPNDVPLRANCGSYVEQPIQTLVTV